MNKRLYVKSVGHLTKVAARNVKETAGKRNGIFIDGIQGRGTLMRPLTVNKSQLDNSGKVSAAFVLNSSGIRETFQKFDRFFPLPRREGKSIPDPLSPILITPFDVILNDQFFFFFFFFIEESKYDAYGKLVFTLERNCSSEVGGNVDRGKRGKILEGER